MNNKKVNISIDGKSIRTYEGDNLLKASLENNIDIPNLCYHKNLTPTGACRLCITKIKGQKGFVPACSINVTDGMEVTAFDEEIEDARKHTLDYLLSEHNEEGDNSYYDELKDLIIKYGLDKKENRKFPPIWKTIKQEKDTSSPVLTYDSSKCIKCFRCIKACSEIQGKRVLSFTERGIDSRIIAGLDNWKESECDGCGECVQLCPTGAIVEKPHRNELRIDKINKKVRTTCPYCGVGCQLEYWIQNGKIVRSTGIHDVMPNNGRLCVKGRFGYDFINSKERLTTPLIKRNGKFEEADWDEALNLIAEKFTSIKNKYGSNALAGYASARCTNEDNYIFQKFIRIVFGTNNMDYCTRLCHASTVTAMLKSIGDGAGSNSIQDFENTECTFVTGCNMIETHPVTATYLKKGKAKGNKIILVDPRWTPLVKYADVWLQAKLGTDVALQNGLVHVIINKNFIDKNFIKNRVERGMEAFGELKKLVAKYTPEYVEKITGVAKEKLIKAAEIYGSAKTAVIATGMGMSQQLTGTYNVYGLLNMMLITGQIGKDNAGIAPPRGQNNVQGATDVGCSPIFYPGYIHSNDEENRKKIAELWDVRLEDLPSEVGYSTIEIIDAAHREEIKGMIIMGENPMHTDPNLNHTGEAFNKLDFLVAIDIFPTLTTEYADVILPASALAEKNGSVVSSDRRVLKINKAVDSPGLCKADWEILVEIAKRMKISIGNFKNESTIFDEIAKATPIMAGISYDRITKEEIQWPCLSKDDPGTATLFKEKFNTPNGKAVLFPVDYIPQNEQPTREYPFILNSGRLLYQYHSATMSRRNNTLNEFVNKPCVLINPSDAENINIKNDEILKLTSRQGEIKVAAKITSGVSTGELFMAWHFNEALVNTLTRSEKDPFSKIAALKYTVCKVEKI
ncbi:MAG TPA: formate dehydrogenase subunit alpha [Victivallales bacterium]|nr:formate dehydrogenase subunit alpha [Victivallales bacterium]